VSKDKTPPKTAANLNKLLGLVRGHYLPNEFGYKKWEGVPTRRFFEEGLQGKS